MYCQKTKCQSYIALLKQTNTLSDEDYRISTFTINTNDADLFRKVSDSRAVFFINEKRK